MADTDLEYSALPTTDEIETGDEVLLVRDGAPMRFTGILPTANGVSDAVAEAEAARDAALAYGNATVKATWAEAAALTGLANGAIVLVVSTDTGTHASISGDLGSVSGQTPNSGVFRYSTSLTALVRIAALESAVAQAWAESTGEPGATGTKSAKGWVNYLLANTGFGAVATDMLLGAASKIVTVGTDLLLGAASKIAIVAADLSLGASSLIGQAPSAASAASASAAAAAASAASVPAGAGQYIEGVGAPGDNVGSIGTTYYDKASGYMYGPKTATGWPAGVAVIRGPTPPATRARIDMRLAGSTLPAAHWTFTRGSPSTDFLETDPYTYGYNTLGNNVPVMRAGKGFLSYMRAQQFLTNPAAPASHTTAGNVAVGTAILLVWGPVGASVTVAQGTAVGTGWGTANCNGTSAVKIVLTITTAGTVAVTVAGAVTYFNLQQNPSSPTATEAVPFIGTTSIREPDKAVATATMIALLNAAQGYMLMGVSNVTGRSYGRSPCLWGINNVTAGYAASDNLLTIYDPANQTSLASMGGETFSNGLTVGRTWDATATVDFGGGSRTEASHPFRYNNGAAVTAATLGHPSTTNTTGANQLNGIVGWYEIDTAARITSEALYEKYTTMPSPTLDALLKGYVGPTQFPHVTSQERLLQAGVIDHIPYGVAGPSHEGGVATGSNVRAVAWMTQMVADLESQGYAVTDDAIVSQNSQAYASGTNAYDPRDTYTGTAPTLTGIQFGGEVITVPATTVLTFTPPTRQTSRFHLAIYTNAAYGNAEVSTDGGTTPIACNENTATSIPSTVTTFTASIADDLMTVTGTVTGPALAAGDIFNGAPISGLRILAQVSGTTGGAGVYRIHVGKQTVASTAMTVIIRQRTFDATLGMKAWSMKATGNPVHVAYRYARNPLIKQRVFFNGGRNGFNVTNLAQDSAPESSYLMLIRALGFAAVIGGVEQTNDMASTGTDFQSIYDPKSYAIISAIRVTADPIGLTDPPTSPAVYTLAMQDRIVNQARVVYNKYGVPYYDLYGWKTVQGVTSGYTVIFPSGLYGSDTIHLAKTGHKRLKANQMGALLKRLWAAA